MNKIPKTGKTVNKFKSFRDFFMDNQINYPKLNLSKEIVRAWTESWDKYKQKQARKKVKTNSTLNTPLPSPIISLSHSK